MLCLGIESTAHTIGIGIAESGIIENEDKNKKVEILANEKKTFPESGIHPRKAADFQSESFGEVFRTSLEKAKIKLGDIDLVAFSQGPGLGPCLRISSIAARAIGIKYNKPIVGVNHCVAHIEISKLLTDTKDPLVIYVSGGNTQIIVKEGKKYIVMGETLDIGIGNMLDVFAREIGEKSAVDIERLGRSGSYILLPYTVKGMDLTFTGILTDCIKKVKENKEKNKEDERNEKRKEDVCYSLQENSFAMVCEAAERALALTKKNELILCGGVAQNKRLQEMLKLVAEDWKCKFGVAQNEFNADNGAMIAYTGILMGKERTLPLEKCIPIQKYRTDEFLL